MTTKKKVVKKETQKYAYICFNTEDLDPNGDWGNDPIMFFRESDTVGFDYSIKVDLPSVVTNKKPLQLAHLTV